MLHTISYTTPAIQIILKPWKRFAPTETAIKNEILPLHGCAATEPQRAQAVAQTGETARSIGDMAGPPQPQAGGAAHHWQLDQCHIGVLCFPEGVRGVMNTLKLLPHLILRIIIVLLIWTLGLGLLGLFYLFLKIKDFIRNE